MALLVCCRVSANYTCCMGVGMPLVMRVHRLRCIFVLCHPPEDVPSASEPTWAEELHLLMTQYVVLRELVYFFSLCISINDRKPSAGR